MTLKIDIATQQIGASVKPFRCTNDDCVNAKSIRADVTQVDWTDKQNQLHALSKIGGYYHDGPYRLGVASEGCHEISKAIWELK